MIFVSLRRAGSEACQPGSIVGLTPNKSDDKPPKLKSALSTECNMKVASSLKTLKSRDRNCQIVRRRGRLYVINKKNPRMKARQG